MMWQNAHDTYLASRVLSADPIELIRMLYQAAIRAVGDARRHLAAGEIAPRARSTTQASAVVIELATSLDHERGGQISANLARLYDYMLRRLTEANLQQSDEPLAEVLGLLTTLSEGWDGVQAQGVVAPARREDALPATPQLAAGSEGAWEQPASPETPATYGGAWEQPASPEAAATYGGSWAQPSAQEAPATNGGSWNSWEQPSSPAPATSYGSASGQPAFPEPAAANGNSREQASSREPAASYGDAWGRPASQEPAAPFGNSWAQLAAQELAAAYGKFPAPEASSEPKASDGNAWAHLAAPEPATSYSPHDWSL